LILLHSDGRESTCHGEVWFFVDEGSVVIATGKDRWKTRALRSGRDRARIWADGSCVLIRYTPISA